MVAKGGERAFAARGTNCQDAQEADLARGRSMSALPDAFGPDCFCRELFEQQQPKKCRSKGDLRISQFEQFLERWGSFAETVFYADPVLKLPRYCWGVTLSLR